MILLRLENDMNLLYFFLGIGALIIWFSILRWAVRSNDIVKNQRLIIHLMIEQYKKQGATEEELKNLKDHFDNQ
jgi:hypothetical protein